MENKLNILYIWTTNNYLFQNLKKIKICIFQVRRSRWQAMRLGKYVDFYLNDNFIFTLKSEGDAKHFGESVLDELQTTAKQWRDENKTKI